MIEAHELELLIHSHATREPVDLVVTGCAYSCCGKGWVRRDGYEQSYRGWIANLELPDGEQEGRFLLYSAGIGTLSYVLACRMFEVAAVSAAA